MRPMSFAARRSAAAPALAGLLIAIGVCGRLVGDDDVVGAAAPRVKPPATSAGPAAAEGPFVVSLVNGDRITGSILSLDAAAVRLQPDVAVGTPLDVPLARIDDIGRSAPPQPLEPRGDRLYPLAGGVIHGTLEGIDARGITIDAHLVGMLTLPLDAVGAFVRDGTEQPERTAAERFHEIHDASGSRLVGQAEFTPSGATLTADGLTATVAIRQVAAILFPGDGRVDAEDAGRAPQRCTLELLNGSQVVGTAPRLERDRLVVTLAPERHVAVPVDNVSRVSFGTGTPAGRRIVFWSQFADLDEEVAHMVAALREGLPRGWMLEAEGQGPKPDELAAALKTAGVLVVPEMESFGAGNDVDAAAIGRDVKAFLGRGGTVVIAGVDDDSAEFWDQAELFSLSSAERAEEDEDEFTVVRGHPLARDVGDSFEAVNATFALETEDPGFEPVARIADGGAAVLVKKVGRGTLVLLGMDYYKRSPAIDRVLVNAVTLRRGR